MSVLIFITRKVKKFFFGQEIPENNFIGCNTFRGGVSNNSRPLKSANFRYR